MGEEVGRHFGGETPAASPLKKKRSSKKLESLKKRVGLSSKKSSQAKLGTMAESDA